MYEYIMVRYGDLILKGKNQHIFRHNINNQIAHKMFGLNVDIEFQHDLVFIKLNDVEAKDVIDRLNFISGLNSYSKTLKCEFDIDKISQRAIQLLNYEIKDKTRFKVETKRADKSVTLKSFEISNLVSKKVLREVDNLVVDVKNPEKTLNVEVRKEGTYLFTDKIPGIGGFPTSTGGRAMLLISGGIDSPVAGYLTMNTGLEIECVHFESSPLTPIESVQKVIDLVMVLSKYAPSSKIKLHLVPFREIHENILNNIPESYIITIMRRMMYRLADQLAKKNNCKVIISGDSIGQVASQTLESMIAVQSTVTSLVIRPLATYDKNEIIKIAKRIKTFPISNRPFSDCCTIYVPKRPVIKPSIEKAANFEELFDYQKYLKIALKNTKTLIINERNPINILEKGYSIEEIFK
ncbi:MAG: tRNA uracil 4-sulfurtransferase ThiI [Candidatus Izemoplasmatales bacterium]|nr:tRNA uracil 4-sulfurtransferase ThiI [Candidatus Izemoplasmatales bacterium]